VRGTHQGGLQPAGSSRARRAAATFKLQPSVMVGEAPMGQLMTRLAKMGAAQDVEHRCRVDRATEASLAMR
jgi:hypothetical protein